MEDMLEHLRVVHKEEFDISNYTDHYHRLPDELKIWRGKR